MSKVNPNKLGVVLGSFMGLVHLLWSVLVAAGVAQSLVDWIAGVHMMTEAPFQVGEFSLGAAVTLVIVTAIIGYFVGLILGSIWNWAQRK